VRQDLHGDARVHVERGQQRSARAPGVVDLDLADARILAAQGEVAGEVPRLVRRAERGREDQGRDLPYVTNSGPVPGLTLGAQLQPSDADIGSGKVASEPGVLVSR